MTGIFWGSTFWANRRTYDVNERQSVTLRCETDARFGTISWICGKKKYSRNHNPNYEIKWIEKEISLKIKCVDCSDRGKYICEVNTLFRDKRSEEITLNVWNGLRFPVTEYRAQALMPITLSCRVEHPNSTMYPDIYWMHNSKEIDTTNARYRVSQIPSPSLKICNVSVDDAGRYECRIKGLECPSQSNQNISISLEVYPKVLIMRKIYSEQMHSTVTFDCEMYGADKYTWKHNGQPISTDNIRYTFNDEMLLTISPIEQSDAGRYVCDITNSAGLSATSEEMELRVKPSYFEINEEEEQRTIANLIENIPDDKASILFVGQIGAGKSSAISSFHSNEGISTLALPGGGQKSFTKEVSGTKIRGKVMLYDSPGLKGFSPGESKQISYATADDIKTFIAEGDQWKCCVVYVFDCSDEITKKEIERMNDFIDFIRKKDNLQMVVMLTKIDRASRSATTVEEMFESLEVYKVIQQIIGNVQLPENCIFRMYNYHKQMDREKKMDLLIMHTFRCLLERLSDIYERL